MQASVSVCVLNLTSLALTTQELVEEKGPCNHEANHSCLSFLFGSPVLHHSFQRHSTQDGNVDVDHAACDNRNVYWFGRIGQFCGGGLWPGWTREFDWNGCIRCSWFEAHAITQTACGLNHRAIESPQRTFLVFVNSVAL